MELSATIVPWDTVPSDSSVKHDTSSGSTLEGTETDMDFFSLGLGNYKGEWSSSGRGSFRFSETRCWILYS
jgi:hypothetical protein